MRRELGAGRRMDRRTGRRAALLLLALAALGATPRAEAADGITLSGHAQQTASVATPFSGGPSFSGGAATGITLVLDARRDSASLRASMHFSILYGDEAENLWASLMASSVGANSLLMAPAFDPLSPAPQVIALFALDDAALSWDIGSFAFEAGKTYANWGVGRAFSPADFFAEFDYSSGTPARRSKLIARATWFTGATSRVDLVYDPFAASGSSFAVRAYATPFNSLACSVAAGFREAARSSPRNILGAFETSFDLLFVSPYAEAAFAMPLDGSSAATFSFLGGGIVRAGDITLLGEYLFQPIAAIKHGIFAQASLPFDEWLSLSIPLLYYPESGALTSGAAFTASDIAGLTLGITATVNRSVSQSWSGKLTFQARTNF